MQTLGVILARAGSAGLANKHLLPVLGRPLIAYTLEHALGSQRISRVVVSTDCTQIRMLARSDGFEVIDRPPHLATADATVQDAMLHAMHTVEASSGFHCEALVVLYGNVAVRPAGLIDQSIEMLERTRCDSVRSFCPVGKWHPAWMSQLEGDRVIPLQSGSIHRRQDLTPLFLHDGGVVAISRQSMLRAEAAPGDPHAFFGVDRRGIQTRPGEVVEVDQLRDLYWAEALLREQAAQHALRMAS